MHFSFPLDGFIHTSITETKSISNLRQISIRNHKTSRECSDKLTPSIHLLSFALCLFFSLMSGIDGEKKIKDEINERAERRKKMRSERIEEEKKKKKIIKRRGKITLLCIFPFFHARFLFVLNPWFDSESHSRSFLPSFLFYFLVYIGLHREGEWIVSREGRKKKTNKTRRKEKIYHSGSINASFFSSRSFAHYEAFQTWLRKAAGVTHQLRQVRAKEEGENGETSGGCASALLHMTSR